ncbi:MAG: glycosyltransferase family 9 protein [Elusimicrobiota bacterium]
MKKILLIQLRRLGDVLLTTPIIDILKEKYPDARIDFLVETAYKDAVTDNPKLTNVFLLNKHSFLSQIKTIRLLRKQKYDYCLDFFCNPRSAWITFLSGAKQRLGFDYKGRKFLYNNVVKRDASPKYNTSFKLDLLKAMNIESKYITTSIYVKDEIKFQIKNFLKKNGWKDGERLIGLVSPNVRDVSKIKNWRMEGYSKLAERIICDMKAKVVILWGLSEQEEASKLYRMINKPHDTILTPMFDVKELAGLISYCNAVVTGCSGPKHIAVALGVPTVTIFGPTQEMSWNPPMHKHIAVKAEKLICIGCDKIYCETMDCMKLVTVDMVYDALQKALEENS